MNGNHSNKVTTWIWKILAIAAAYFVGTVISGAVITAAGMSWPAFPNPPSQAAGFVFNLIGSVLMAGCLALLAWGVRGSQLVRWLALAAFSYVTFGLNNQLEAAIFTTFGGTMTMIVFFLAPCLLGAAAAVQLITPDAPRQPLDTAFTRRPGSAWWRLLVAWLAMPVIYLFFGSLAGPLVVQLYREQGLGLTIPGFGTIIPVELARSALYLAVTIPVLLLWSRSRRALLVTLAIVLFAMMGLIGLLTATFFPPTLRIVHTIEILGDAVVYAWALVALFVPKARAASAAAAPASTR